MENKYYTPELEEFHVGFEYEYKSIKSWGWFDDSSGHWVRTKFSGGSIENEGTEVDEIEDGNNSVRVKLLDREDIESFGFDYYHSGRYEKDDWLLIVNSDGTIRIKQSYSYTEHNDTFIGYNQKYLGTIKNKSELRKVLSMLGIER